MDRSEKITRAFGRAYDAERRALLPVTAPSELVFTDHVDGQDDELVALFRSGWSPTPSRRAGRVESQLKVEVVETAIAELDEDLPPATGVMTLDLAERCHRLTYTQGGPTFVVTNFDRPTEAPRQWTFWCEELVLGAIQ